MKLTTLLLCLVTGFVGSLHGADKAVAGPKGGRLLDLGALKAEFFVTAERRVEITFYDAGLQGVPATNQSATVIAETPTGRTPLALEKTDGRFVSKEKLPEGEPYRIVVQLRETREAKPQNFRLQLNLETCGECNLAEYACICGH